MDNTVVDNETIEKKDAPTNGTINDKPLVLRDERGRLLPGSALSSYRKLVEKDKFDQYRQAFLSAISPLQMQHMLRAIYREAFDGEHIKNLKAANMLLNLAYGKQAVIQLQQNNITADTLLKVVEAGVIEQI